MTLEARLGFNAAVLNAADSLDLPIRDRDAINDLVTATYLSERSPTAST